MKAMSWRDWRWLWLWQLLRAVAVLTLIVPWVALYLPAKAIVAAFDWLGDRLGSVHVRWHNRDLAVKRAAERQRKGLSDD